jgi:hypothetical protein
MALRLSRHALSLLPILVLGAPARAQVPDHLACYKIKDTAAKTTYTAALNPGDPAFAMQTGCVVKVPPKLLCIDVRKSNVLPGPPGAPDGSQASKYLCYKVRCPAVSGTATLDDQFGTHAVELKRANLLCAPVTTPSTVTTTTSTTSTTLACPGTAGAVVNEVAPNITGGADLVELYVTSAGPLAGMTLEASPGATPTLLATLPPICAAAGDIVAVHTSATGVTTETQSKTDSTGPASYPFAWDVVGTGSSIVFTDRVLALRDAGAQLLDAVPFSNQDGAVSADYAASLVAVQGVGEWIPADCSGSPCAGAAAEQVAVDWTGAGMSTTADTVRRGAGGGDTNQASDWSVGVQSLGLPN